MVAPGIVQHGKAAGPVSLSSLISLWPPFVPSHSLSLLSLHHLNTCFSLSRKHRFLTLQTLKYMSFPGKSLPHCHLHHHQSPPPQVRRCCYSFTFTSHVPPPGPSHTSATECQDHVGLDQDSQGVMMVGLRWAHKQLWIDSQQKVILLTQVSLSTSSRWTLWEMLKIVESGC